MDAAARLLIQLDCTQTTMRFFAALDGRDHAACARWMAPHGVWERQGTQLRGPDEVAAALDRRPADRLTCHVVTNAVTTVSDASHCDVRFWLVAYEGSVASSAPPAARMAGIRLCTDEYVLHEREWKLERKSSRAWMAAGG